MIRLSEQQLARLNARPEAAQSRLRDKCPVPFEL
jgi:hypothetical protein